jgi:hypothetical protein
MIRGWISVSSSKNYIYFILQCVRREAGDDDDNGTQEREREKARGAHGSIRETTTTMVASELGRRACARGVVIALSFSSKFGKIFFAFVRCS